MNKSISKNSIFYAVYNLLNVLFPFVSGMYAAHVLIPETIGEVTYAGNIAQYFVILAFLGLPTYGLREISRAKDNKTELNKVYSELFIINLISTTVFLFLYFVLIICVTKFRQNIVLYIIVGIPIALNAINISWLYEGLEEFKFISLRNIFFKTVVFLLLITLVKDTDDYLIYASLSAVGTAGNYLINVLCSKRFVTLSLKELNLRRHMKSIFLLVAVNIAIEIYSLVDITMLGIFCKEEHVTYYYYGHKINMIFMTLLNTFTVVLVPRLSSCFINDKKEFNRLLTKGLKTILILAVPMICGVQFVSDFLMCKFYGDNYISSSYVLRLLSFVLLISPIGYLLGSRVLLVAKREKLMVLCVGTGAIVNIIGNSILIPRYQEFGAALASVISELIIMLLYVSFGSREFSLDGCFNSIRKVFISAGIMCLILYFILNISMNGWLRVILQICSGVAVYFGMMFLLKEEIILEYGNRIIKKVKG